MKRLKDIIKQKVKNLLSDRAKRIIVLTTLYCILEHCEEVNRLALLKLNRHLNLVNDTGALVAPWLLTKFIWTTKEIESIWSIQSTKQLNDFLLSKIPSYLKYSESDDLIKDDVSHLIEAI